MNKKIFFHVGLGKTASTFLQEQVFPFFKDVEYIHRNYRYQRVEEIISEGEEFRYFVSREFDQQFEQEVTKFAKHSPDAKIIIVFRRHDGWIASQYRRFFKNGHLIPFNHFFDLENDKGVFKKKDLDYSHYLQIVEDNFTQKPLVLFYEDLKENPIVFFDRIAEVIGITYDMADINLKNRHSSYSEKQLKALRHVGNYVNLRKDNIRNKLGYIFTRFYTNTVRYNTLFLAKYLPENWFGKEPLIATSELDDVRNYYEKDWEAVKEYAQINNPV